MTTDPTTMHIGELAERTGLSLRTLRHYDEVGLVSASGRTEGGFRLYTQADHDRLILIRRMKPLGFTLDEMADLLSIIDALAPADQKSTDRASTEPASTEPASTEPASTEPASTERARLESFITEAELRREKLRTQLAMADEFLDLLRAR